MGIVKGLGAIKEAMGKGMEYVKMKSGEALLARILVSSDDIMGVYEHTEKIGGYWKTITCIGRDKCPLCKAGKRASFKAYIPVLDRSDDKVKIYKASKDTIKIILGLVEEYGELTSRDYKIVRQGDGLDTVYQFFPKDPVALDLSGYEVPDIESKIAPMEPEAIRELMEGSLSPDTSESPISVNDDEYPF